MGLLGNHVHRKLATYLLQARQRRGRLPPGPWVHPLYSHSKQIAGCGGIVYFFRHLQCKYGEVFTVWMGGTYRVVISGYANIHAVLKVNHKISAKRSYAGIPEWKRKIFEKRPGISRLVEWKECKAVRQQIVHLLLEEGMGKPAMERIIVEEADEFCKYFIEPRLQTKEALRATVNPLTMAISNTLFKLLVGERFDYGDPKVHLYTDLILKEAKSNSIYQLSIPFTRWIPGDPFGSAAGQRSNQNTFSEMISNFDEIVTERRKFLKDGCSPSCMLDHMLLQSRPESGDLNRFDDNIGSMLQQLYTGGTVASSFLCWALLYLSVYPEVQTRVFEEIRDVIDDGIPEYSMRGAMCYTDAFLLELFRHSSTIYLYLPRTLESELMVDGKVLPANTELMFNIDSVYNDPDIFSNVDEFDPERFFRGDIEKKKACVEAAFGIGKRNCVAAPLGKAQIFLILTRVLQQYSVTYEGNSKPSLRKTDGINIKPPPHGILFTRRREIKESWN